MDRAGRLAVALALSALTVLVGAGPAAADHEGSCDPLELDYVGAECVHVHGVSDDVLDALAVKVAEELGAEPLTLHGDTQQALAVKVADEIAARELTLTAEGINATIDEPLEVWVPINEDWRYTGLLAGGAALACLSALVVGQLRSGGR